MKNHSEMKNISFLTLVLLLYCSALFSQVAVNNDASQPDPSAMLDVKSNARGVLLPRMTIEQIAAISTPANGLVVFCITDNKFYIYVSGVNTWKEILYGTGTIAQFSCGSFFTIDHVAGSVAPVSKTVTYGTVTNIPGEPSKCWITSNLGADHQATTVDDATEASGGWYWQFNRMQGYKHDGTTRTPGTPWQWPLVENSNWQPVNDPCAIELGGGWRIPTGTEWNNVDAAGNWTNWTGPWNSGLKLHAGGYLDGTNGLFGGRGVYGNFWSSTMTNIYEASGLNIDPSFSYTFNGLKAYGISVRCVRNN